MEHIDFDQDRRILKLDHVFVRHFSVVRAEVHSKIQSSDHFPLELRLKL